MSDEKGLLVWVYKDGGGDCSMNGISANVSKMVLIGKDVPQIFSPSEDTPAIYLKMHMDQPIAVPKEGRDGTKWVMFGGNFLYSSDSRFREVVNEYPIRIHDRIEG